MSRRLRENLIVTAFTVTFFLFLCFVAVKTVAAHSFYPPECCSGTDCDVIAASRVRPAFAGYMVDGIHYVPMGQVRQSPDSDYHGCFPTKDKMGCFWAPPQGS